MSGSRIFRWRRCFFEHRLRAKSRTPRGSGTVPGPVGGSIKRQTPGNNPPVARTPACRQRVPSFRNVASHPYRLWASTPASGDRLRRIYPAGLRSLRSRLGVAGRFPPACFPAFLLCASAPDFCRQPTPHKLRAPKFHRFKSQCPLFNPAAPPAGFGKKGASGWRACSFFCK